jgi:Tfp pilus assembly protein PilN
MNRLGKWWIAIAGGALIAGIVGVGAVAAQTPIAGTNATGTTFLSRVAAKLGIDTSTLDTAVKSAQTDEIDARVASGNLTQAQADQMKLRIANEPAGAGLGGGFGDHGPGMGRGPGFGDQTALAGFFGITTDQLKTESSANGATLATIAAAHGKSRDDLKTFLTTDAKTRLAQEVTAGHLTQAQADTKLADLTANLDTRIDSAMPAGHGPGGRGGPVGPGFGDGNAPSTPGSTTTPSANNG